MPSPVQITFRDLPPSDSLSAHIERRVAKLDTFFDRIHRCHVVVESPHRHHTKGKKFHCRIDIHLPGKELIVSKNPDEATEDVHAAIDDAFGDAERALEQFASIVQHDTKTHLRPPHGVVARIFPDRGYGFIAADDDGHEVYFHRNSVLGTKFEKIAVGAKVRYAEEDGDKGPQASTVHVVGDPSAGLHASVA